MPDYNDRKGRASSKIGRPPSNIPNLPCLPDRSIKQIIEKKTVDKYDNNSNLDLSLQEIDLKSYAKIIIEHYRQEILRAYTELGINPKQLRLGGNICFKRSDFENTDKFDEIVNSRDKYLWYGLVYDITEILFDNIEGDTIGGFTTGSMRSRWVNYVFKAVFQQGTGGNEAQCYICP